MTIQTNHNFPAPTMDRHSEVDISPTIFFDKCDSMKNNIADCCGLYLPEFKRTYPQKSMICVSFSFLNFFFFCISNQILRCTIQGSPAVIFKTKAIFLSLPPPLTTPYGLL